MKSLESTTIHKAAASVDMGVIDRQISGWVHSVFLCTLALIYDS